MEKEHCVPARTSMEGMEQTADSGISWASKFYLVLSSASINKVAVMWSISSVFVLLSTSVALFFTTQDVFGFTWVWVFGYTWPSMVSSPPQVYGGERFF